jgi:heme exporter protein D
MSYQNYVIGAYAVFFVVLLWDLIAPRIDIARQLRAARLRASRKAPRPNIDTLSRTEIE